MFGRMQVSIASRTMLPSLRYRQRNRGNMSPWSCMHWRAMRKREDGGQQPLILVWRGDGSGLSPWSQLGISFGWRLSLTMEWMETVSICTPTICILGLMRIVEVFITQSVKANKNGTNIVGKFEKSLNDLIFNFFGLITNPELHRIIRLFG